MAGAWGTMGVRTDFKKSSGIAGRLTGVALAYRDLRPAIAAVNGDELLSGQNVYYRLAAGGAWCLYKL